MSKESSTFFKILEVNGKVVVYRMHTINVMKHNKSIADFIMHVILEFASPLIIMTFIDHTLSVLSSFHPKEILHPKVSDKMFNRILLLSKIKLKDLKAGIDQFDSLENRYVKKL